MYKQTNSAPSVPLTLKFTKNTLLANPEKTSLIRKSLNMMKIAKNTSLLRKKLTNQEKTLLIRKKLANLEKNITYQEKTLLIPGLWSWESVKSHVCSWSRSRFSKLLESEHLLQLPTPMFIK